MPPVTTCPEIDRGLIFEWKERAGSLRGNRASGLRQRLTKPRRVGVVRFEENRLIFLREVEQPFFAHPVAHPICTTDRGPSSGLSTSSWFGMTSTRVFGFPSPLRSELCRIPPGRAFFTPRFGRRASRGRRTD